MHKKKSHIPSFAERQGRKFSPVSLCNSPKYLDLSERSPIHVGAAEVKMLVVNEPHFCVQNPISEQTFEVEGAHFRCFFYESQ